METRSSLRRDRSVVSSGVVYAKAQYFSSSLDRATIDCFLQDQKTRLEPRKMQIASGRSIYH